MNRLRSSVAGLFYTDPRPLRAVSGPAHWRASDLSFRKEDNAEVSMPRGLLRYRFLTLFLVLAELGSVAPTTAISRTVCASTAAELRQALAEVSDGGAYVDTPTLNTEQEGTYLTDGTAFSSSALTTTASLTIVGGWRAPLCNTAAASFTSTVLDGQGASGVLKITRPNALVDLRKLRVQNGNADVGAGIQVNYGVTANAIVGLTWVAVVDNH